MSEPSADPDPGRDDDPGRDPGVPGGPRPAGTAGWRRVPDRPEGPAIPAEALAAWLEAEADEGDPEDWEECFGPEDEEDPEEIAADCRQAGRAQAEAAERLARAGLTAALAAAGAERRGPGMPGSADVIPGEYAGPAALFASGMMFDAMPGRPQLAAAADEATGPDDAYDSASDDELVGILCAWDRMEAHAAARKHAAAAELIRRRPAAGCEPEGAARMPGTWDEFTVDELAAVLGASKHDAGALLDLAYDLTVKLPGTRAALRDGIINVKKAAIISWATEPLDPAEARAAEALVLSQAGPLSPGGLRAAIARAVVEVAADKARKRREQAAKKARVERWAEYSGNAALVGRELPPAEVLAADQRVSWWARQLRKAGLNGSLDELRAKAYLDLLLGTDSRPRQKDEGSQEASAKDRGAPGRGARNSGARNSGTRDRTVEDHQRRNGADENGSGPAEPAGSPASAIPASAAPAGVLPTGFAGRVHLTVPLATLLGLADRPGEIPGIGAIDPWLARDLGAATAQNPQTAWCVTVTDEHGHAIGHGCARPEPKDHARQRVKPGKSRLPGGPDPPGGTGNRDGPGFAFTATGQHGPPDADGAGGYGTWRLTTGAPGRPDLLLTLDPIAIDHCDHRFEADGHDPGVKLRHLTEIRHATCTGPTCRRPATTCDFEHNIPYEAGGRSCMCNGGPKCRHDHRLKQHPRWKVDQVTPATIRWTTPSGRQFTTGPTRYPT